MVAVWNRSTVGNATAPPSSYTERYQKKAPPRPRMFSARPATIWLTLTVAVITAISSPSAPPPTAAPTSPSHRLPVSLATRNPVKAPRVMVPSRLRFRIPLLSATSSPVAAISSGVAILNVVTKMPRITE